MYSPNFQGYPPIYEQLIHAGGIEQAEAKHGRIRAGKDKMDRLLIYVYQKCRDEVWALTDIGPFDDFTPYSGMMVRLKEKGFIERSDKKCATNNKHFFKLTSKGKEHARKTIEAG